VRCTFVPAKSIDAILMVVFDNDGTGVGCVASFLDVKLLIGNE
jgi:hypothetical protein